MATTDTPASTAPKTEEDNKEESKDESQTKGLFEDISPDNVFSEIESLCMNCHEQGTTRLLLTRVPYFKEIVVMAFSCPHCGYESNEIQPGGTIQEKGVKFVLNVSSSKDLNRQVVKSDTAVITIPELDFEIPALTQKGSLNTIEGFLTQSIEALKSNQEERKKIDPETAQKLEQFITRLESTITAETPNFTFTLDDPAGNSFIENPHLPKEDPNMHTSHYERTDDQNLAVGLTPHLEVKEDGDEKQVMTFPGVCSNCHEPGETNMVVTNIPYFKEIVLMAFTCPHCGFKSNEVKCGGAVSPKGRKITLKVTMAEDLARDILKSETATVHLPDIDVELGQGTLGGRFTTIEGLLNQLKEEFEKTPFFRGDSADPTAKAHMTTVMEGLDKFLAGNTPFTLIIDDPLSNSYIQNSYAPDDDPNMEIEDYERTFDQNEVLGLNDMKTENYDEEGYHYDKENHEEHHEETHEEGEHKEEAAQ